MNSLRSGGVQNSVRTKRRLGADSAGALALIVSLVGAPPASAAAADAGGSDPGPDDDPWGQIAAALALDDLIDLAGDDAGAAANALAAAESLPPPIARSFLDGLLREQEWDEWSADDIESAPDDLRAVEEALLAALAAAPESALVGEAWGRLYWSIAGEEAEAAVARLVARLGGFPDPARSALVLSDQIGSGAHDRALLGLALERRPGHPVLLHAIAERSGELAVRAALYEAAWERLSETRPAPSRAAVRFFAERRLGALLAAGELASSLSALAEIEDRLGSPEDGGSRTPDGELDGLPLRGEREDLRLRLAALGWLIGDPDLARRHLAAEPAAGPPPEEPPGAAALTGILDRLLAPRGDDPFRLLTALVVATADGSGAGPVEALPCLLAATELAQREGYSEIAAYLLGLALERLEWQMEDEWEPDARWSFVPPPLGAALEARIEAHRVRLEALVDELRSRRAWLTASAESDAGGAAIARSLAADRPRFVEQPVPAGIPPAAFGDAYAILEWQRRQREFKQTTGFDLERVERLGDEVTAVAATDRGDSWVLRSRDGGATWAEPLAIGLHRRRPYGVPAASRLPLIAADGLRLEVELWDSAEPAVQRAERVPLARAIYLEIPWADLERDGDGDGVTDLEEGLILTDAADPDSDGDGSIDGLDLLPQVAARPGCDARAEALAAVLRAMDEPRFWTPGRETVSEGCSLPVRPARRAAQRTRYLVGRRAEFAQLHPDARLVVLDEHELAAAETDLGVLDPLRLRLFAVDRSAERALAVWGEGGGGGLVAMRRLDDGWTTTIGARFGGCLGTMIDLEEHLDPREP